MQAVLTIDRLPAAPIEAAAQFHREYLRQAENLLAGEVDALAIVLPSAPTDHDDWRRTLARDLARASKPKRVNVVGAASDEARDALLSYLGDAPGVTGQYCPAHE